MRAIWYHLHNLKNVKNTHGGMLLFVQLHVSAYNFTETHHSSMGILHVFEIMQMEPNPAKRLQGI